MDKTTLLIIPLIGALFSPLTGQTVSKNKPQNPIIQSAILPGWGESTLGHPRTARIFNISEGILWLTFFTNVTASEIQHKNYIAFAAEHAAVTTAGKDHKFWVDMGNYNSLDDYNAEHLRNRDVNDLYPSQSTWNWTWDSSKNRSKFERIRINSDLWKQGATFVAGGIVLNHLLSIIDVLYLKRIQTIDAVTLTPVLDLYSRSNVYRLTVHF